MNGEMQGTSYYCPQNQIACIEIQKTLDLRQGSSEIQRWGSEADFFVTASDQATNCQLENLRIVLALPSQVSPGTGL